MATPVSTSASQAQKPSHPEEGTPLREVAELPETPTMDQAAIQAQNAQLEGLSAEARLEWLYQHAEAQQYPVVASSSFGAQAAATLHLVVSQRPETPIILVDTGYLFPETYHFIETLTKRLSLQLHIARAETSPAWQESVHGKLWEQGLEGLETYNRLNKVEPMKKALQTLKAGAWIAGLRRQQSQSREQLPVLTRSEGRLKLHPIIDWTDKDIYHYFQKHDLPYHPLWEKGYVSIGDTHTTRTLSDGMSAEDTRFFGLKRECGLHEDLDFSI